MLKLQSSFLIEGSHPALPGHFPGTPVVPGVVLLDRVMAQLRAQLGIDPEILELPQIKFVEPLLPETIAHIEIEVDGDRARFKVRREDVVIATGALHWPSAL